MKTPDSWINPEAMPPEVAEALQRAINRTRRIIALRGLAASVGAGLAGFLLAMALDARIVFMDAWPRWVLSGIAWGATVLAVLRFLVRPLRRIFSLSGMARIIEQKHPELQERLSSIVELTAAGESGENRGSAMLIQALAGQAIKDVDGVNPDDAASLRSIRPWLLSAVSLMVVLGLLFLIRPRETAVLLGRAAFPMANIANLSALDMDVVPGDARVGEGRPLTLSVKVHSKRGQEALLYMTPASTRRETIVPMNRADAEPDGRVPWSVTMASVQNDFTYRIRLDRAVSRFFSIQAVPPPVIRSVAVQYRFPSYSGLADAVVNDQGGAIHGLEHTRVKVVAKVNKLIAKPELLIKGATPLVLTGRVENVISGEIDLAFEFILKPGLNGLAVMTLTDEYGFVNPPWERTVQAMPDLKPVLTVLFPDKPMLRVSRQDQIPLLAAAVDDLGLSKVEWRMEPAPRPAVVLSTVPGAVSNRPPLAFESSTNLVLSDAAFTGAVQVVVTFRAADNRDADCGGPQWVSSPPITLAFDAAARSVEEQAFAAQEAFVKAQLETAQKELTLSRDQLKPLGEPLGKKDEDPAALQRLAEANRHVEEAAKKLDLLAEGARDGYLNKVGKEAADIAKDPLAQAERTMDQVPDMATPAEKSAGVTQALANVQAALDQTQALTSNFLATATAVKQALVLKDLAQQENQREQPATNAAAQAEFLKERKETADRLSEVMKTLPSEKVAEVLGERLNEIAEKTEAIRKEQDGVADKVKTELKPDAEADKALQDLSAAQSQLAQEAQNKPEAKAVVPVMQEASALMKRDELEQALVNQDRVLDDLRAKTQTLMERVAPPEPDRAEQLAKVVAKEADKAARRADQAADSLDKLENRLVAEAAKKPGEVKPEQNPDVLRKLAQDATAGKRDAEKLADQAALQADAAARQAEVVTQADDPREKEKVLATIVEAAKNADALADKAEKIEGTLQAQAAAIKSLPERAVEAEARAAEAAKEADAAADTVNQLAALAPDERLAKKMGTEVERAAEAAAKADVAAAVAKKEAEKAKALPQQQEAAQALEQAEKAAATGEKEAAVAAQALAKAQQELMDKPAVAARIEEPARQAEASAQQARLAAEDATDSAVRAREAAEQVKPNTPAADEMKTLTDAAVFFEKKAQEAAHDAKDAAKQAAKPADPDTLQKAVEKAAEDARRAESAARSANEFGNKAEEVAAKGQTDKSRTEQAAEQAKRAATEAGQAAEKTQDIAKQADDHPAETVLKALGEEAKQAALRADEAAKLAADLAKPADKPAATPKEAGETRQKAEHAALEARGEAETARTMNDVAEKLSALQAPEDRAQAATKQAEDAAREAAQAEARAREAAQKAAQPAPAETKPAVDAAQEAARKLAAEAERKAAQQTAAEAAQAAAQASQQARQAAGQARQAADESARAATPVEASDKAAKAEQAALEAVKQAAKADRQADRAEQAVPETPDNRLKQAVADANRSAEEATRQATEAAQSAETAKKAADQAKVQAPASDRSARLATQVADAAEAAGKAAQKAQELAREAAKSKEAAGQAVTPSAAEARAFEASEKADEAGKMAVESALQAAEARASLKGQELAALQDLTGKQRELAAKTRDALENAGKPTHELWNQAADRQAEAAEAVDDVKADVAVARLMADAAKKPDVAGRLDRAMSQAVTAEQSAEAANKSFEKAAQAAEATQATPPNADTPAGAKAMATARQNAETVADQARLQAERTRADVAKNMEAAGQEAKAAAAAMTAAATPDTGSKKPEAPAEKALDTMAQQIPEAMTGLQAAPGKSGKPSESEAIRDALNQAAKAAAERAEALGGEPQALFPKMNMPAAGGGGSGIELDEDTLPGELGYEAGARLRNWFKLSGDISGTVMENAEDGEPDDYRGLIRRYFKEVSRRSHEE
jgi:hypothetical protein